MRVPTTPNPNRSSALARIQQGMALASVAAAVVWAWAWVDTSRTWALVGAALVLFSYVPVLGLQFLLMASVNRRHAETPLGAMAAVRAWWREVLTAPQVFSWRQPFRWRAWPDAQVPAAPGRVALVLVHGFVCNRGLWGPWMRELRRRHQPYTSVNLEPVFGSIDDYVPLIEDAVQRAEQLTGRRPLLVCHSMGGLAARAWLAGTPGGAQRVCAVVTIGTPHRGTWLARWSHVCNGRQMRVGGAWLQTLAAQERGQPSPPFVCWYSNADNIVFPASTATLPGADNRCIDGVPHVAMAFHPQVFEATLALAQTAD